jgi:hypothetical protein
MCKKLYLGLFIFFCWFDFNPFVLQAQELNTLTVNSPSGLAGDYRIARALFGGQSNDIITAEAIFGNPTQGCTALTSNGFGKVVFLDRGACAFDVKCLNAQNSGAVAVVICAVLVNETIQMMPAGAVAPQVTIPAFYASKETCDKLRVDLTSGGVHVTLKNKACPTPTYTSNAVWGDTAGEGDFSNGLGDWTTDKGWVHNPEGVVRNGAYTGGPKVVGSETYCNGVAEFNSDYLDNRGMTNPDGTPMAGIGDCPSVCTAYLLSPNITFANPIGGLTIEYSQSLRQFQSQYYIMVSRDGGATFSDTVRVNAEYPVNSNHNSERKKVALKGFEGATQVRFKFECIGNYYYWAIDDVVVYDDSYVDLQINREWYSVAPYYKMPQSFVSEIPLMVNLSNNGNADSENTLLKVKINGPDVNQTIDFPLPDIEAGNSLLNTVLPARYVLPDPRAGTYRAEYIVENDFIDLNPDNNKAGFQWKVTYNTFGTLDNEEEFGSQYMVFYTSWIPLPSAKIYSCANVYYVPEGTSSGIYAFTKARYGLQNSLFEVEGQSIRLDLFEWNDLDNSGTSSPSERTRVGCNYQVISSDIPNLRSIETDIWVSDDDGFPIEGQRVYLKENTHYLISASVTPSNPETDPEIQLLGFTPRNLDDYSRSIGAIRATNFALDSLETLGLLGSRVSGSLYAFENINDTSIEDIDKRNFRFIYNGVLYTKFFLELDIAVRTGNTSETILPANSLKTFPNPAARDLFIDLHLEKISETVEVSIYDMDGKLVDTKTFNKVLDDRLKLDISNFTNGAYHVKVITSEGVATRKVIINN